MQNPALPQFIMCENKVIIENIEKLDELDRQGNPDPEQFRFLYNILSLYLNVAQRAGENLDTFVPTPRYNIAITGFMSSLRAKHIDNYYAGPPEK